LTWVKKWKNIYSVIFRMIMEQNSEWDFEDRHR
jgi:hypothetical protein